jgi:hypothetical protein
VDVVRPVNQAVQARAVGQHSIADPLAVEQPIKNRVENVNAASSPTGRWVPTKFATPPR